MTTKRVGDLQRGDKVVFYDLDGDPIIGTFKNFQEKGFANFIKMPGIPRDDMREIVYTDENGFDHWCVCGVNEQAQLA